MISPAMLPRDTNGLIPGAWRLVHKDKTFSGELGVVPFRNGLSVNPVTGHTLARIVAIYGHILFIELVEGARMPEGYSSKVPEAFLAKLKRAPWREEPVPAKEPEKDEEADGKDGKSDEATRETDPPPVAEVAPEAPRVLSFADEPDLDKMNKDEPDLDKMNKDELTTLAEQRGINVDGRWGEAKLRSVLKG